jgi:hypothetical protein
MGLQESVPVGADIERGIYLSYETLAYPLE